MCTWPERNIRQPLASQDGPTSLAFLAFFPIFTDNQSVTMEKFLQNLQPQHFWDIDYQKINGVINKRLIIERIAEYGSLSELRCIIEHYGRNEVINTLTEINWLHPKTLNFISKLFDIPKIAFKCYTPNPLKPQHWSS